MNEPSPGLSMTLNSWKRISSGVRKAGTREPDAPWWCSVRCICEDCLDFDALVIEHHAQVGDRPLFARTS